MDNPFIIFPAIDLRHGEVVRLKEGDPERQTQYSRFPDETARRWLSAGPQWLHVVNLDGAFGEPGNANQAALMKIIEEAQKVKTKVQFGGGLRDVKSIEEAFNKGVDRVVIGTMVVENMPLFEKVLNKWGPEKVAVSLDAREGLIQSRGWQEITPILAVELAKELKQLGLSWLVFTDIARDGLQTGYNIQATYELSTASGLNVIASGGVSDELDIMAARESGMAGIIIGRALYEGLIDLKDILQKVKG